VARRWSHGVSSKNTVRLLANLLLAYLGICACEAREKHSCSAVWASLSAKSELELPRRSLSALAPKRQIRLDSSLDREYERPV